MICDICQGRDWIPEWNRGGCWKQCRNSAAWRATRGAPEACPYGLELNALPVGDNAPQGVTEALPMPPMECVWADRASCCKVNCTHPEGDGLVFVNAHCQPGKCRHYTVDMAEEGARAAVV